MDQDIINNNKEWIDEVWRKLDKKLSAAAVRNRGIIPYTSNEGCYDNRGAANPAWWSNGFWGGMMWLMYTGTENEEYKKTALASEQIIDEGLKSFKLLDHDAGFLRHIVSGANYRITGDEAAYSKALYAAASLASRFNVDGGYIRAWNSEGSEGWSIIDCMMNLPLLYWASEEIGDPRFKRIAIRHADMVLRHHIRADGSVNHIVAHDTETGEVLSIKRGQGYSECSCWSRGLAWAIYGMTLSYKYTNNEEYLAAAVKTANYFAANAAAYDYKTPVDFRAPREPAYYDSSAGVCSACALLELTKYVSDAEAYVYTDAAFKVLKATDKYFCNYDPDWDSVVQMATERYPADGVMRWVHVHLIYADFFFAEAMNKLRGNKFCIW